MTKSMNPISILFATFLISTSCFGQVSTAQEYSKQAYHLAAKGKIDQAIETFETAIEKMPDSMSLYFHKGNFLTEQVRFEDAIKVYTTGLERSQSDIKRSYLLAARGATWYRLRDFENSYSDLDLALQLDSTNLNALNNLAVLLDETNRPEEALGIFIRIIAVDPTYVAAYINIGYRLQQLEDHEIAINYFDMGLSVDPASPLCYSNRSFSKLKLGDLKGAMKDVNKSLELFPNNSYAYKIRALIFIEKNKIAKACKDLEKAESLGYTTEYGEEVDELLAKYCE